MKLNWKQKWLDDKSGYWYSAKIPVIDWEYVIDVYSGMSYEPRVFYSKNHDEPVRLSKKNYKTLDRATKACEKHLLHSYNKIKKWVSLNEE